MSSDLLEMAACCVKPPYLTIRSAPPNLTQAEGLLPSRPGYLFRLQRLSNIGQDDWKDIDQSGLRAPAPAERRRCLFT